MFLIPHFAHSFCHFNCINIVKFNFLMIAQAVKLLCMIAWLPIVNNIDTLPLKYWFYIDIVTLFISVQ